MANLYNSEGYFSPTEYEAMTRIEKEEKAARKAANFRPIVYICLVLYWCYTKKVDSKKRKMV